MSEENRPGSASAPDETKTIGRGAIYLTLTKLWFLVSGYVIYFALPRLLGEGEVGKALFGKYLVVTGAGAILNALVIQGTTQAVSRFVGRDPESGDGVRRAAYKLQALIGGGLFALMFLAAPLWAEGVYGDPELTTPLRCASFILLFYAFYAIFMGYLNGRKMFARQALADFSYSTMKVIGVLAGAIVLKGSLGAVAGPVAGFAASAGFVTLMAYMLAGRARGPGELKVSSLFLFQMFTMAFTFCATWVSRGDLQILKVGLRDVVVPGLDLEPGTTYADVRAGEYGAAQAFATIPYQAVFAITFILFPLVSAAAGRDVEKMRAYIRQTTRYAAMIATMIACLFVACPERTITILFKPEYAPAAEPLRVLGLGYLFYSVFFIMCATVTASGRPWISLMLVALVVGLQIGVGSALVGSLEMQGVAIGTTAGMVVGLILAHLYLLRTFGQGLLFGTMARILACGAVTGLAANVLLARSSILGRPGLLGTVGGTGIVSKALTAGGFGVLGLVFIWLLLLTRVVDDDDKAKFRKVLKRGG